MKKEILSALALTVLLTGCEQIKQPQTPDNTQVEIKDEQLNTIPEDALDMDKELMAFYGEWKGTKYKAGGVTKKGIDSSALTQKAYKEKFYTDLPRTANKQLKTGTKVKKVDLILGDIIFYKRNGALFTGIYMGEGEFMHASNKGVKMDRLDKKPYTYSYYTARRVF